MDRMTCSVSSLLHMLTGGRYRGSLPIVKDALLYTVTEDDILHYDVVSTAPLLPKTRVCGCGISSQDQLRGVLGEADAPKQVYSTQTGARKLGKAVTADLVMNGRGEVLEVCITGISDRPTVGISWKKETLDPLYPEFAETLERNGAYAVYLPCVSREEEADAVLDDIDGILMTGGADLHPATFGQTQSPHGCQGWNRIRDKSDLLMTKRAIGRDIPLLGICRGTQGLNVALGGPLIQDIPLYLGEKFLSGEVSADRVTTVLSGQLPGQAEKVPDMGYKRFIPKLKKYIPTYDEETGTYQEGCGCEEGHLRVWIDGLRHSKEQDGPGYHTLYQGKNNEIFVIDPGSKWLYDIIGSETMEFITSTHHQAVDPDGLGEGITIAARSSDGIVEAIEYKKNLFALGVQWHPERDALHFFHGFPVDQKLCNAPLRALVDHSRICMQKKQ